MTLILIFLAPLHSCALTDDRITDFWARTFFRFSLNYCSHNAPTTLASCVRNSPWIVGASVIHQDSTCNSSAIRDAFLRLSISSFWCVLFWFVIIAWFNPESQLMWWWWWWWWWLWWLWWWWWWWWWWCWFDGDSFGGMFSLIFNFNFIVITAILANPRLFS